MLTNVNFVKSYISSVSRETLLFYFSKRQFLFLKIVYISIGILITFYSQLEIIRGTERDINMGIESIMTAGTVTNSVVTNKDELKAKIAEANKKKDAEMLYMLLSNASDETKSKSLRKDVRDELKDLKKAGLIDEDVYKDARKMTKNTWLRQLFGKKKDSQVQFKNQARFNKIEETRKNGPEFSKDIKEKLADAKIKAEDLYAVWDKYGSSGNTSDNFVNYSYRGKQTGQPGELHEMQAHFNQIAKNNGSNVEFSAKETKEILKDMGIDIEETIRPGKVIKDAAIGAAVASPLGFVKMTQSQNSASSLVNATQDQTLKIAGAAPIVGGAIGTAYGIAKEFFRTEPKVADKTIGDNIQTYDDYANYMDTYGTKKGATLMKNIAKYYDFESGFDKKGLEKAMHEAASEDSVLNYEEAFALYTALKTGEIVPEQPKAKEPEKTPETRVIKETCEIEKTTETKENIVAVESKCHTVQKGENWYEVAKAKYGATGNDLNEIVAELKKAYYEANKEELNKKGINSPKGAFFPAVGEELCLPETIKGYHYNEAAKVNAGKVDNSYKGATISNTSNPFTKKETKTVHVATTCDGTRIEAESKEALDEKIKKHQEQNPDKNFVVR